MTKRRILKELRKGGYLYLLQKGGICGIGKWKISVYLYDDLHPPIVAIFTVVRKNFYYIIYPFETIIYGCCCEARPKISKIIKTIDKRVEEYFHG